MVASESNYRLGEVDKILTTQSKVNNNIVMLIKKLDKRLDKMQKDIDNNWRELKQGEKYKKEYVKREAELYLIIKRTRKYKKMWRELHKVFGNYWNAFDVRKANNRDCDYKYVNELMEEVEQKHFPKEVK